MVEAPPFLQLDEHSGLIPQVAFISAEGKKVLPFLHQRTKGSFHHLLFGTVQYGTIPFLGSGYRSFRIHDNYIEAYVDRFPVTDIRGIFKVCVHLVCFLSLNTLATLKPDFEEAGASSNP